MIALSQILPELISANPILLYGLRHKLLNLTQLAAHLQPQVEVRAKKDVSKSAILMALSRYQKQLSKISPKVDRYRLEKITVYTGLSVFSFAKDADVLKGLNQFHAHILKKGGYATISEGISEVTMIVESTYTPVIKSLLGRAKYQSDNIAALAIHFPSSYIAVPGMLCMILQQVMLQGINVLEVASTYTEFVLYLKESDIRLAFDTLYRVFEVRTEA